MLLEIFFIILLTAGVLIFLMNKRENPPTEEETGEVPDGNPLEENDDIVNEPTSGLLVDAYADMGPSGFSLNVETYTYRGGVVIELNCTGYITQLPGEILVSGDIENIMNELGIQRAVFVLDGQPYMGDYVTPLLVNVKEYSPYL